MTLEKTARTQPSIILGALLVMPPLDPAALLVCVWNTPLRARAPGRACTPTQATDAGISLVGPDGALCCKRHCRGHRCDVLRRG